MDNNEQFNFTYSAAQQQEIKHIRNKYLPKQEDKMEKLRRLHKSASKKARLWAITIGIIGSLNLGTGMSLAMTNLGALLGIQTGQAMLTGVAVGIVGMVLIALAYPIYNRVLEKERRRIAPEILQLTEDLLK